MSSVAQTTTCAYCGAPLKRPGARFCSHCGREQPAAPVEKPTLIGLPAQTPMPATQIAEARLVVQESGQTREVALANRPLAIGRASDNDLLLISRFVSARHARIEPEGSAHRIVDVGSTNGLLFEGRRVQQRSLNDGDVVRIGDPATGNFVTLTYRNPAAVRAPASSTASHSYRLNPNDPQISIGRGGCEVLLDNPQVSRLHAQIERQGGGALLRDMGSTNGTFVNGVRITQHALKPGDIIQVGPFKLVYNVTSLDQYDQRGALRIDARGLTRRTAGKQARLILNDVSLSIAPREFVALVGGSGAGKSTLLKALSGSVRADEGTLLVNGDDFYRNFDAYRALLGYVPQDDIIHRELPVGRALDYAARLRLPADTAPAEIDGRIARVLDDVEMGPHRSTIVDNLSGGQRKRVSIGVELLADPSLFFLDEPTSGLDPGLEKKMMYTLRRLADSGRTVVLVTHATANITQCDHVAFMAGGRMVYFGPPDEALDFFGVISGDFADIYTRLEGRADPQGPVVARDLKEEYEIWRRANPATNVAPLLGELWEMKYRASQHYRTYVAGRLEQTPPGSAGTTGGAVESQKPRVSPLRQLAILTRRYFDLTVQDRRNLLILLLQAPIIALLLLFVLRGDALNAAQAQGLIQRGEAKKVLFMLATVGVWFGIINAAREIVKEQAIYQRERMVNLRIFPYLSSKVAVLSLLVLVQSAILLGMVMLKVGFPGDTGLFAPAALEVFVTLLLTALAGSSLGLVISAWASSPDRAISIVPLALIPQIVFAGLIFKIEGAAEPFSWLTISRWSMEALGTSIDLNSLCNLPNLDNNGAISPLCAPGALEGEAAYSHSAEHLLTRWGILLLYSFVCIGLTAWLLRRRDQRL